jgi:hypothetical protein
MTSRPESNVDIKLKIKKIYIKDLPDISNKKNLGICHLYSLDSTLNLYSSLNPKL